MSRNDIFDAASSPGAQQGIPQQSRDQVQQELGFDIPVETVPLPSLGLAYEAGHPLHQCQTVDIRAMTAREEDILTSRALIKKGTVITHLIKSCLTNKDIDVSSLLAGDRNALMIAVRITGYGEKYNSDASCPGCGTNQKSAFNLSALPIRALNLTPTLPGANSFEFILPLTGKRVEFKFATGRDEEEATITSDRRRKQGIMTENIVTNALQRAILSVDGDPNKSQIANFVRHMPARDSLALRNYISNNEPGVDLTVPFSCTSCDHEEDIALPMGVNFFWPQA
jgi:hypothetical protein